MRGMRRDIPSRQAKGTEKLRCFNCWLIGHLRKVCRRQVKGSKQKENQASCERMQESSAIQHLIWSKGKFQRSPPEPPPSLKIEIPLMAEPHAKFGQTFSEKTNRRTHRIRAVADTGEQTCSSGQEILKILGCTSDSLITTNQKIRGVTDDQLRIKGVLIMRIRVGIRETWQVVYVSGNTRFYLSESALKDLELIPRNFPSQTSKIAGLALVNGKALSGFPEEQRFLINQLTSHSLLLQAIGTVWNYGYGNISSQVHLTLFHINPYKWWRGGHWI